MTRFAVIFLTCVALSTAPWAAGVKKQLRFVLDVTTLGGYLTSIGDGWTQQFKLIIATSDANAKSNSNPKFVALVNTVTASFGQNPNSLPPLPHVSVLGPRGNILSSEQLPAAFAVTRADCTIEYPGRLNGCPFWDLEISAPTTNPGRVLVEGQLGQLRNVTFLFDFNAALPRDRWVLLNTQNVSQNFAAVEGSLIDQVTFYYSGHGINTSAGWFFEYDTVHQTYSVSSVRNK